jgi:uncharacterized protein (TIGR03118 family)
MGFKGCKLLVASQTGAIDGYNPSINPVNTINLIPPSDKNYTGLTITDDSKYIFATDFANGVIDKYDSNLDLVLSFTDPSLIPFDYYPYGIQIIGDRLYVTFSNGISEVGNGYIDTFDFNGGHITRFANRGNLNQPYSIFQQDNKLYISNFGNGYILIYSHNGNYEGKLSSNHNPIVLNNLSNILYKDGKIYFTSTFDNESNGIVGYIKEDSSC